MTQLTIAFSGLSAFQDRFSEPLPHEFHLPIRPTELLALYRDRGEDAVLDRIIELVGYQFAPIWTIIADLAPVHYHCGDFSGDLEKGYLCLCAHEPYDEF
jgi:hypothetical protein